VTDRTFNYSFTGPVASPVGTATSISLAITEIEDAGIREVLQTPGAALGSWALLDALLASTGAGTPFVFREPLGQAREVKVALSGLFGRFVARAYLERYHHLSVFCHLRRGAVTLDGRRRIEITRRAKGDLPDWVASSSTLMDLTVAEAKGCHDRAGPTEALTRAVAQAARVDVSVRGHTVPAKRIAIATRWGASVGGPADPQLAVHDPEDDEAPIEPADKDALFVGLLRMHLADLLAPLGHEGLSQAIREIAAADSLGRERAASRRARRELTAALGRSSDVARVDIGLGDLIGGVVTRAGPVSGATEADESVLARLHLRPVFVGVEHALLKATIGGEANSIRNALRSTLGAVDRARGSNAGGWIVPLGAESSSTTQA
jgi:hypothetical protein